MAIDDLFHKTEGLLLFHQQQTSPQHTFFSTNEHGSIPIMPLEIKKGLVQDKAFAH
ncbi:MAG: hypothetical protein ACRC8B_21875 [Aeromonas sobria]|uniref:hypothetical protein n=1 Tax=Aeromonas sobria TaxID=646 RepID=UPI003F333AE1